MASSLLFLCVCVGSCELLSSQKKESFGFAKCHFLVVFFPVEESETSSCGMSSSYYLQSPQLVSLLFICLYISITTGNVPSLEFVS